ncbi:MAG: hypothetical protein JOY66_13300 [Acetobacteraceae bacterium]|nr:hypothetical protein [Acetobacteraceae bacterium]
MARSMLAAIAAASLLCLGQGTVRAAGEPNSNPRQAGGTAPGQQFGTSADVGAKKQLDEKKYQKSPAELAAGAHGQSSSSSSSK